MESIVDEVKFKGDLKQFITFLRKDPQFYAKTPEELLTHARNIAKKLDNIKVYYSSSLEDHSKKIASLAILKSGILVTNDESAEIKVRNITETMKISTFRKAFDPISDYDRYDNSDSRRNKKFKKYDVYKKESFTENLSLIHI